MTVMAVFFPDAWNLSVSYISVSLGVSLRL